MNLIIAACSLAFVCTFTFVCWLRYSKGEAVGSNRDSSLLGLEWLRVAGMLVTLGVMLCCGNGFPERYFVAAAILSGAALLKITHVIGQWLSKA
jgi:hypothetical protein